MKVHSTLGNGFFEIIYQRALAMKFKKARLMFMQKFWMSIFYGGVIIGKRRVNFFVESLIRGELKAKAIIETAHFLHARNYLEVHNVEAGLLLNFGNISLEYRRIENAKYDPDLKAV